MSFPQVDGSPAHKRYSASQGALNWLLLVALLVGALLRGSALGRMDDMLHYDEAYNGMDALSLLRVPHLTPFFPGNYGREAGWIYYLTPFVAVFGARPFALRLAGALAGVLTLVAVYALGRELLGRRAATWATAALAVFYWPVHINHLALRANLFPLVGALALAALLHARRTKAIRHWIVAGLGLGLLLYTYYAARLWMAFGALLLAWWFVSASAASNEPRRRAEHEVSQGDDSVISLSDEASPGALPWFAPASAASVRRGVCVALLVMAVVCLPMLIYMIQHPGATARLGMVSTLSWKDISANLLLWARAWFQRGDSNAEFNLPGRPILDPALGMIFVIGCVALACQRTRRGAGLFLLGLGLVSLLPSLLSDQAPHFLRALGLSVPISLVLGMGAAALVDGMRRVWPRGARMILLVPLALLALSGTRTYLDFHTRWLHSSELPIFMEQHINRAINYITAHVPSDTPVYFTPFTLSHPVLVFRAADLAPRPVGASDSHSCLAIPDRAAVYVSLTLYEPAFETWLSQWADLRVLNRQVMPQSDQVLYTIYEAVPHAEWTSDVGVATFGEAIQMRVLMSISTTVHAGDVVPITLGLHALRTLDRDYSVFVHMYGDPTPYQGGRNWGQGDSQACASYPSRLWRTDETVVQEFQLQVAANTPPGTYRVAVGLYESPDGARLPLTRPAPHPDNYIVLQTLQVTAIP